MVVGMGYKKKNRFDEFMLKFDRHDKSDPKDELCDLGDLFNYCMVIEDKTTGIDKKHYFDDPENIPKILGNQEVISRQGQLGVKIFNKEGKLTSHWEKLM